ncbi:MAG: elongation factor Ts [Dehalococcoidia bacterium]
MEITTAMIKELRDLTGAGVMAAKRALEQANGDMKRAAEIIREEGAMHAAKRADRETKNGVVEAYIHANGRIGVLVELNCETDFVANTEDFRTLARNIAMQVAAMAPQCTAPEDRTSEMEGPDDEVALLSQAWIKDPGRNVGDMIKEVVAKTHENIRVSRFVRYELGR